MDYKTLHPDVGEQRERYLLLMVDLLTKYVWYLPTPTKAADGVARFVEERCVEWLSQGFKPNILHTDNGGEFINASVTAVCVRFGLDFRHGLPGHPQAQGAIERVVGTFSSALAKACPDIQAREDEYDWVKL